MSAFKNRSKKKPGSKSIQPYIFYVWWSVVFNLIQRYKEFSTNNSGLFQEFIWHLGAISWIYFPVLALLWIQFLIQLFVYFFWNHKWWFIFALLTAYGKTTWINWLTMSREE